MPALPPLDEKDALGLLLALLSRPTAPFHEHRVRGALREALALPGLDSRLDGSGNLVVRYRRGRALPLAFVAHMDHPGFELLSVEAGRAEALWNGQVPPFPLRGQELALWRDEPGGRLGRARVLRGDGRLPKPRARRLKLRVPPSARAGDFGHADLGPPRLSRELIRGRALDNNAGCAAVAAALRQLARRRLPGDLVAVFTRAEEVGFHGSFAALAARAIPRARPVLVLECSRALPGAEIGKGPVIRVGDRLRVFDADLASACERAAGALKSEFPALRFQRRLMDGGACEASAFGLAGYRTLCLAFPLGNYHNAGPRGLALEHIARADFLDGVRLLVAFSARGLDPAGARRALERGIGSDFGAAEARRLRRTR